METTPRPIDAVLVEDAGALTPLRFASRERPISIPEASGAATDLRQRRPDEDGSCGFLEIEEGGEGVVGGVG
ncbi:hypothetical protein GCM10009550_65170 [Actinocorallia libanotica]|uniref:Uncharacterized protein n=1 Tax=Actinocorallia libanotica TaxID=46162 RepID=A0ABP4CEZ2_9ACTN